MVFRPWLSRRPSRRSVGDIFVTDHPGRFRIKKVTVAFLGLFLETDHPGRFSAFVVPLFFFRRENRKCQLVVLRMRWVLRLGRLALCAFQGRTWAVVRTLEYFLYNPHVTPWGVAKRSSPQLAWSGLKISKSGSVLIADRRYELESHYYYFFASTAIATYPCFSFFFSIYFTIGRCCTRFIVLIFVIQCLLPDCSNCCCCCVKSSTSTWSCCFVF